MLKTFIGMLNLASIYLFVSAMSSALCNLCIVAVLCFIEMPLSWSRGVDDDDTGKRNNVAIENANHLFIH